MSKHVLHVGTQTDSYEIEFGDKQLYRHTLVIGQSGSGKSFMLARLVEELVLHSEARLVILDINGDFVTLNSTEGKAWNTDACKKNLVKGYDLDALPGTAFKDRWTERLQNNPIRVYSPEEDLLLAPGRMSRAGFREMLGLNTSHDAEGLWLADRIYDLARKDDVTKPTWALSQWELLRRSIVSWARGVVKPDEDPEFRSLPRYLATTNAVSAAQRIANGLSDALEGKIWNNDKVASPFEKHWDSTEKLPLVTCIDLASITAPVARFVAARYVLERLWDVTSKERADKAGNRRPVFVVIDEAHNLAPPNSATPAASGVLDMIRRTAAEGRKEGLFLFLATQRPRKLHDDVLSECDNVALMKLVPRGDVDWLRDRFTFVDEKIWASVALLEQGEAYFLGSWALKEPGTEQPSVVPVRGAPRRTLEGGGDLDKERIYEGADDAS